MSSASAVSPTRTHDPDLGQEHIREHQHGQEDLTPRMIVKLNFQEAVTWVLRMKRTRQHRLALAAIESAPHIGEVGWCLLPHAAANIAA